MCSRISGHVGPTNDLYRNRQSVAQLELRILLRNHEYDDPDTKHYYTDLKPFSASDA